MNKTISSHFELAPDLTISKILIGLWQIADMEKGGKTLDPTRTSEAMHPYVDAGFDTFDMADHYGSSEIITGRFRASHPDKPIKLFTKWVPKAGKISREDVRSAVMLAVERMQLNTLDLLQFHAWHYPDPSWLDGLFYLKELQDEGLIQHLGVTNFDAAHLRVAISSGIPIISNQVCHSLIDQRASGKLTEVCQHYPVKLLAFGTLAGGFLTDKWLDKTEPKQDQLATWSEMKYKRFIDSAGGWDVYQNLLKVTKQVAERHSTSIANVATRFILEGEAVAGVIIGARLGESEHIADHEQILELVLSDQDIQAIVGAQQEFNPIPGDCGDEYRKPPFLTASGDLSHHIEEIPKAFEVRKVDENRSQIFSGTEWEAYAGYCRAVKDGNRVHISGTTATHENRMIGGEDPGSQTHFIIDKIEAVMEAYGGSLKDIVRTRIFVHHLDHWEAVARAHGERFDGINPANTLVQAQLVGDGYLVEIEAEAVLH